MFPPRGGMQRNLFGSQRQSPQLSFKQAYPAAVEQTGVDYDKIMEGYRNILDRAPGQFNELSDIFRQNLSRQPINYSQSGDVTSSLEILKNLAETGGYSDTDVRNLRERGVSPIRAIYGNAQRNLNRQRSLSGGYAPNFAAASTRMAREMSGQIGEQMTRVNADIADRIASGKQSAAPQFASFAGGESDRALRAKLADAEGQRSASGDLASLFSNRNQTELSALSGMQSLYGTTPALASTFGDQAYKAASMQGPRAFRGGGTPISNFSIARRFGAGG